MRMIDSNRGLACTGRMHLELKIFHLLLIHSFLLVPIFVEFMGAARVNMLGEVLLTILLCADFDKITNYVSMKIQYPPSMKNWYLRK